MNGLQKRETFIALRARKQGYQIACEVLNPPLRINPPTVRDPDDFYRRAVRFRRWGKRNRLRSEKEGRRQLMCMILTVVVIMAGIGIAILAYQMAHGSHA